MEGFMINQRLCSSERDTKTKIKLMEDLGNGQHRYRVRAKRSGIKNNHEIVDKNVPFASREIQYQVTAYFIHWMLKSNFLTFSLASVMLFVAFTFVFALAIMIVAIVEPRCVTSATFLANHHFTAKFNDALSLSWTTFSTVGYGGISPATSGMFLDDMDEFKKNGSCCLMGFVLSFESLIGILFVSFAGALIYVKLIQFQSAARVKFSSVMVVKYGSGVDLEDIDDDDDDEDDAHADSKGRKKDDPNSLDKLPCPIIIFRMANLLHSTQNGEVVNAHVKTVATIDLKNAVMSFITRGNTVFRNALNINIMKKARKDNANALSSRLRVTKKFKSKYSTSRLYNDSVRSTDTASTSSSNQSTRSKFSSRVLSRLLPQSNESERSAVSYSDYSYNEDSSRTNITQEMNINEIGYAFTQNQLEMTNDALVSMRKLDKKQGNHYVEKNVLMKSAISMHAEIPNLVFANVKMDPVHHPYFRTSWRVVHTLNAESPLVKKDIRKRVEENGGHWPSELNNHDDVKNSIDFDQFLVSFRGLSKATGNEVYGHHVYRMDDINVGMQFKSILVQNENGSIGIEPDYIDELKLQHGGL